MVKLYKILSAYIKGKREAGFKCIRLDRWLTTYIDFIVEHGHTHINYKITQAWLEHRSKVVSRIGVHGIYSSIQMFSHWAYPFDNKNEILPRRRAIRQYERRRTPNILNAHDAGQLIKTVRSLPCKKGLTSYTNAIITGVMFTAGLRFGEALGLRDDEVRLDQNYIYVRAIKGARDRLVPITESTKEQLIKYRRFRDEYFPNDKTHFFLFDNGPAKSEYPFRYRFRKAAVILGYRESTQHGYNRKTLLPHDLRHSYAVNSLIKCYKEKRNLHEEAAKLTVLMGHKYVSNTYWYIQGIPELMTLALQGVEQ